MSAPYWGTPIRRPGTDDGVGADYDGDGVPESIQRHNRDANAHPELRDMIVGASPDWFQGDGPPSDVVPGAGKGDLYLDRLSGLLYRLS